MINDIAPTDLDIAKRGLKHAYPYADWQIVAPDVTEGRGAKGAQPRFESAITEYLGGQKPTLILLAHGAALPRHVTAMQAVAEFLA